MIGESRLGPIEVNILRAPSLRGVDIQTWISGCAKGVTPDRIAILPITIQGRLIPSSIGVQKVQIQISSVIVMPLRISRRIPYQLDMNVRVDMGLNQ